MASTLELLTPEGAARYLGGEDSPISTDTLRWWRYRRVGPVFHRVGRRIMYRRSDLDAFVQQGEVRTREIAHA